MKCPSCDNVNAYIGFSSIECINPKCTHFSQLWLSEVCRNKSPDTPVLLDRQPLHLTENYAPTAEVLARYFRKFDIVENTAKHLRLLSRFGRLDAYTLVLANRFRSGARVMFRERRTCANAEWGDIWDSSTSVVVINITKLGFIYEEAC